MGDRDQNKSNQREQQEMIKINEKKNYESNYPIPQALRRHLKTYPKSFNIQAGVALYKIILIFLSSPALFYREKTPLESSR